jgi:hypothetical protein
MLVIWCKVYAFYSIFMHYNSEWKDPHHWGIDDFDANIDLV